MAVVFFPSELRMLTGEEHTITTATVFRDIVNELVLRYEKLDQERLMEMAIAVDGEIIHTPFLESIAEDSELHFLHRISGG